MKRHADEALSLNVLAPDIKRLFVSYSHIATRGSIRLARQAGTAHAAAVGTVMQQWGRAEQTGAPAVELLGLPGMTRDKSASRRDARFPHSPKKIMIYSNLLHLSYNMWGDWENPKVKGKYWACKPYLRFDEKVWNDLLDAMHKRGLNMVDATCSDVVVTHDLVKDLAERGYDVVYVGRRGHPEPEGVIGEAPGKVHLVQDPEDVDALDIKNDKIAVTCQTTLSIWDTAAMIKRVRDKYPQTEAYNEICRATQDRQEAAVEAAKDCDVVIVVGSERSSNSKRLVQVVQELAHKPAYLVDTASDIKPEWLQGKGRVGVTSGASTPTQLTREVIEYLEAL